MPADTNPAAAQPRRAAVRAWAPVALRLALLALFVAVATWAGGHLAEALPRLMPGGEAGVVAMIAACLAVYVVCLALPFVPGVEFGIGLLAMFGAAVAPAVWGATVLALALSFLAGRMVPMPAIAALCRRLRLHRAATLADRMAPLGPDDRLALVAQGGGRAVPFLLRNRHLALALALNLPGNAVLGGGGGIGLMAGASGLFTLPGYLATVALAAAPVPVLVWLAGMWT